MSMMQKFPLDLELKWTSYEFSKIDDQNEIIIEIKMNCFELLMDRVAKA